MSSINNLPTELVLQIYQADRHTYLLSHTNHKFQAIYLEHKASIVKYTHGPFYSFALKPEEEQPSGVVNLSRVYNATGMFSSATQMLFTGTTITHYTVPWVLDVDEFSDTDSIMSGASYDEWMNGIAYE